MVTKGFVQVPHALIDSLLRDKEETIRLARRIGTFETSIQPFEDCCTLFQPEHPVTGGKPEKAAEIEALVDVEALVDEAVTGTVRHQLREDREGPPVGGQA